MRLVILAHGTMLRGVHIDRHRPNPGIGGTQFTRIRLAQEFAARFPQHEVEVVSDERFTLTPAQQNLSLTPDADFDERLRDLAADQDPWVMTGPSMLLKTINVDILRAIGPRSIVTSHLMHDADLWAAERHVRFAAAGFVGIAHFHASRSRAPKVYLRDLFLPGWDPGPVAGNDTGHFRIVHVGALLPLKGFHDLARQWPRISRENPGAVLEVIGGSETYGRLGDHSLLPTEQAFGDEILRFIPVRDVETGRVVFHGNLGAEKRDIIGRADVAILNVAGRPESLCAALLECLDLGVPVIGSARHGLWDSMRHFPECATRNPVEVPRRVQQFSADSVLRSDVGTRALAIGAGFRAENNAIVDRWEAVAAAIVEGAPIPTFAPTQRPRPWAVDSIEHISRRLRHELVDSAFAPRARVLKEIVLARRRSDA